MNLQKLFEAQAELDRHIVEKKRVEKRELICSLVLS